MLNHLVYSGNLESKQKTNFADKQVDSGGRINTEPFKIFQLFTYI